MLALIFFIPIPLSSGSPPSGHRLRHFHCRSRKPAHELEVTWNSQKSLEKGRANIFFNFVEKKKEQCPCEILRCVQYLAWAVRWSELAVSSPKQEFTLRYVLSPPSAYKAAICWAPTMWQELNIIPNPQQPHHRRAMIYSHSAKRKLKFRKVIHLPNTILIVNDGAGFGPGSFWF